LEIAEQTVFEDIDSYNRQLLAGLEVQELGLHPEKKEDGIFVLYIAMGLSLENLMMTDFRDQAKFQTSKI